MACSAARAINTSLYSVPGEVDYLLAVSVVCDTGNQCQTIEIFVHGN